MKQKQVIIHTTPEVLLEMFDILKELPKEVDTEQNRIKILYLLGAYGREVSMFETDRSKKEVLKDLKKQWGNVLDLRSYKEEQPND